MTIKAIILVLAALAGMASAQSDLFVYDNATAQLPDDPGQDTKDSLDIDLADVDGDGDLDIFVVEGSASAAGFPNLLWINDGNGNFTDESAARIPQDASNSVEVDFADIDGDGDLDAAVSNLGENQLLINDGSGFFTAGVLPQATPPGPPGFAVPFPPFFTEVSTEARFADVDGDGDPDLLISNENPFPFGPPAGDFNRILINDGTGTFTDETFLRFPLEMANTNGFAVGDIDGDGDLDLVEANVGSANRVLINVGGAGFFTDETALRLPGLLPTSTRKASLGDVDGDGDLDLVTANSRGEQNRLFLNDGTGVFTDVTDTHIPAAPGSTTHVELADLDGDGDLDMFYSNVGTFVAGHGFLGEPNVLLLNDGQGVFTDGTFPRIEQRDDRSTVAASGDLDGDGVRDLVVANSGGVDQPGLPAPDGEEELFLRRSCSSHETLCLQRMITGLDAEIGALDPTPGGDMTSSSQLLNQIRKGLLQALADGSQRSLDRRRRILLAIQLAAILTRVDGRPFPPDWVAGEAGGRMDGLARFALRVLVE